MGEDALTILCHIQCADEQCGAFCVRPRRKPKKSKRVSNSKFESLPRKPKDRNCPKRPKSAYFLFGDSVREQTRNENPNMRMTEITRFIGAKWKELNDAQKRPFIDEAARLKVVYTEEVRRYKMSDAGRAFKQKLREWESECQEQTQRTEDFVDSSSRTSASDSELSNSILSESDSDSIGHTLTRQV